MNNRFLHATITSFGKDNFKTSYSTGFATTAFSSKGGSVSLKDFFTDLRLDLFKMAKINSKNGAPNSTTYSVLLSVVNTQTFKTRFFTFDKNIIDIIADYSKDYNGDKVVLTED